MSLALFTHCLPVLLGYILFVGISGRLDPVSRPRSLAERPSWALGLWVALAVASILTIGLRTAYGAPLDDIATVFVPSVRALSVALLVGLAGWFAYRGAIVRALEIDALDGREASLENARIRHFPVPDDEFTLDVDPIEEPSGGHADDASDEPADARHPLVATFLDVASPERLDIPDITVAAGEIDIDAGIVAAATAIIERAEPVALDVVSRDEHEITLGAAEDATGMLCLALRSEEAIREETERHLRATRGALVKLETESREREGEKADALIALEEELECRIRESAASDSRASREAAHRVEAETTIVALKQDVLAARRQVRRSTASRAKALSVATRSVALTRQAVKARARLEKRLRASEARLADRETTLGSVVRALERERGRTQEEVGALARQLVLNERQLRARRSMENVARSVEDKLTTRLARKVARARPFVVDN